MKYTNIFTFPYQYIVRNGTTLGVESALHACQGCCDPVSPHSTSPLTFCGPDSVTIVNTCCKGIMTAVSLLSWQTGARSHLAHRRHGCLTSLAHYWSQAMVGYILIFTLLQSHYGALATVWHQQRAAQCKTSAGQAATSYFLSSIDC